MRRFKKQTNAAANGNLFQIGILKRFFLISVNFLISVYGNPENFTENQMNWTIFK